MSFANNNQGQFSKEIPHQEWAKLGGCGLGSALMQIYISEDVFINAGGHSSKVVYYQNLFKQIVGSYSSVPGR